MFYLCGMEKSKFEQKIAEYVVAEGLLEGSGDVLVTLSGGADSVALLLVLRALGYPCRACHCNFHLRGDESARDEAFVRSLTSRLGVECSFVDFDVDGYRSTHDCSVEMACRRLRYDWFEQLRSRYGCRAIAVAHHADDCIETFFLNLLRGTGISGIVGIKPRNGDVVRPLLCVRRADIEDYLSAVGESFVVDSTNLQTEYKRNKIRNIIMPTLLSEFPGADQAILDTLANLRGDLEVFRAAVGERRNQLCRYEGSQLHVDLIGLLRSEHPSTLLHEFLHPYGFTSSQLEDMLRDGLPGALFMANGYVAERTRGEIIVAPDVVDDEEYVFSLDDVTALPTKLDCSVVERTDDFRFDGGPAVAYFDESILDAKLSLRHWRQGDRFQPFGMKCRKKLSDFFSDNKFSILQKRRTWLLCEEDKILWIVGHRAAAHYAVGEETKRVVVLKAEP